MTISLYSNKSDNRSVSKNITLLNSDIPIVLKENTDIVNPVISMNTSSDVIGANYCYIPDFGRYYYIVNKTYSQQKIYLQLSVDVLMSFASDIKASSGVCIRSSNRYNNYFRDNQVTALTYNNYYIHKFPHGFNKTLSNVLVLGGTG